MFVKELWRYPVKSMAGERIREILLTKGGLEGDRQVLVAGADGRVITSRTHPLLLGLKGTLDARGKVRISGHPWDSAEARELVRQAAGPGGRPAFHAGVDRFDILPLLVATDGAIAYMGLDGRRLRPNIVIGGVEGLAERQWEGKQLRLGEALIEAAQLRGRCVMTTYDPDTLEQDRGVLRRIVKQLEGRMALDCWVEVGSWIREGDAVTLVES